MTDPQPRNRGFARLPRELVLQVAENLDPRSRSYLAQTNAGVNSLLRHILPQAAREFAFSSEEDYGRVRYFDRYTGQEYYHIRWLQYVPRDPIEKAIAHLNYHAVLNFLDAGVNPNSHLITGHRLLFTAASWGARDITLLLLSYGANPNVTNVASQNTPLLAAATEGDDLNVTRLINAGANVNSMNAIHSMCRFCSADTVRFAVERGADLRRPSLMESRASAIHEAAMNPDPEVLAYVIEAAPDLINDTTPEGRTALWAASDKQLIENVDVLIKGGINISHRDVNNETVLYSFLYVIGSTEIPMLLMDHGIEVNIQGLYGCTELHHAARNKVCRDFVEALLERGLDANARDHSLQTSLHCAASNGDVDILKTLVEEGHAVLNPIDQWGNTPLDCARMMDKYDAIEYLEQKIEEARHRTSEGV